MITFSYCAMNANGHETAGTVEALTLQAASELLKRQGLFPTHMAERAAGHRAAARATAAGPATGFFASRLKGRLLCEFTRQLATLLDAGMPLLRSLRLLQEQQADPGGRQVLGGLAEAIEGGSSFSESLARYPRSFDRLYVSMARAGEVLGALDKVLVRQAEYLEKRRRMGRKV